MYLLLSIAPLVQSNRMSVEEIRVISDDKPKFGQTIDVRGEAERPNVDGNSQLHFPCA